MKDQCPVCTRGNFSLPADKEDGKANDAYLLRDKMATESIDEIEEKVYQFEEGFG